MSALTSALRRKRRDEPVLWQVKRNGRTVTIAPSAREIFPALRDRMLASRPVVGHTVETVHADGSSSGGRPIYGKPTFRNVIEDGKHV